MSNQNIASDLDLFVELSTQEQENLSGGQYFPGPYPYQPWGKKRRRGGINVRVINKPIIIVGGQGKKKGGGYGGYDGGYGGYDGGYGGYDGGYGGYGGGYDGGYGSGYGGG